jgi:hypothetical protein
MWNHLYVSISRSLETNTVVELFEYRFGSQDSFGRSLIIDGKEVHEEAVSLKILDAGWSGSPSTAVLKRGEGSPGPITNNIRGLSDGSGRSGLPFHLYPVDQGFLQPGGPIYRACTQWPTNKESLLVQSD